MNPVGSPVAAMVNAMTIDVEDYYANLPESLHELRAAWERGSSEYPAMLR